MSTVIKLKQTVVYGDRTQTTEGEFTFDREFLITQMVEAAVNCFRAASNHEEPK